MLCPYNCGAGAWLGSVDDIAWGVLQRAVILLRGALQVGAGIECGEHARASPCGRRRRQAAALHMEAGIEMFGPRMCIRKTPAGCRRYEYTGAR